MSTNKPIISVITATYNRRHTLPRVWESLRNQTEKRFEWIIVDDGSTDDTKAWVDSLTDSRIRYFRQENQGVHPARNRGNREARGKYVAFMDSDDEFYDDETLAVMLADIESAPDNVGVVLYRVVENDTGHPADSLTEDRIIARFEDHVCDRYEGEYSDIMPIKIALKFPWPVWRSFASPRHLAIFREYDTMIRTRPVRIYHWNTEGNFKNAEKKYNPDDFKEGAMALREFIADFAKDWLRYCPAQIGKYNFHLAAYELISGTWYAPIIPALKALRYGRMKIRMAAIAVLCFVPLPRFAFIGLLRLRRRLFADKRRPSRQYTR